MIEAADTLERDLRGQLEAKERELDEARDQVMALEEENRRILDTLVRHSKEKAEGIVTGGEVVRSGSSQSLLNNHQRTN